MTTIEIEAINQKRHYPYIDQIISDESLISHLKKHDLAIPNLLILGTALFNNDTDPCNSILRSLEDNLTLFCSHLTEKQKALLASNLLNNRIQFLNTISELGLARFYLDRNFEIDLFLTLPLTNKDVDLFARCGKEERWIDIINAAPQDETSIDRYTPVDLKLRLVTKIINKFESKFRPSINAGWDGKPWIALDFTKNDSLALSIASWKFTESHDLEEFWEEIMRKCPALEGVIYFTHYAYAPKAHWVREFRR